MEDYNEKVNYGSVTIPLLRDRLEITSTMYGFNLFDRKNKVNLLFSKSKGTCEEGKSLLLDGKIERFESFKNTIKIKYEEVVTNKILIYKHRDGDDIFSIPTLKDFYKVCLHILNNRFENNYFSKYNEDEFPKKLDYTEEDIEKMPESFRKEAKDKLNTNKRYINDCKEANREYELVEKALKEEDGHLASTIIKNLDSDEIEIVEPRKL
jgi:hypothetical protein